MDDFDVNDYMGSDFVQKDELVKSGAQRKRITGVEQGDGLPRDGKTVPELVLVFSDGKKHGLRARRRTRKRSATRTVRRTNGWIGKVIELYVDPSVRNPSGQKVGGIRIRIPDGRRRAGGLHVRPRDGARRRGVTGGPGRRCRSVDNDRCGTGPDRLVPHEDNDLE